MGAKVNNQLRKSLIFQYGKEAVRAVYGKIGNALHRCTTSKRRAHKIHYQDKQLTVFKPWIDDRYAFVEWSFKNGYSTVNCYLDRIDNSLGYCPENCRYVDKFETSRNRTNTRSRDCIKAAQLLKDNGFSRSFILEHFPTIFKLK